MGDGKSDTELELLSGILSEVQDLNASLARIDERSNQNRNDVITLREERISPLESQADRNRSRSRRNSMILGAAITLATILVGAAITYGFSLL